MVKDNSRHSLLQGDAQRSVKTRHYPLHYCQHTSAFQEKPEITFTFYLLYGGYNKYMERAQIASLLHLKEQY